MKTDPRFYRPTMRLRGLTRRKLRDIGPDTAEWVEARAIQQWWEGPLENEGEWRDIPSFNEWELASPSQ